MIFTPINHEGYSLFHAGCLALSEVEANGIQVDVEYLAQAKEECRANIARCKASLLVDPVYTIWRRKFGAKTNLGSREQLGSVVFDVLGTPCSEWTDTGRPITDDAALRNLNIPFVRMYLETERWKKALNTYLRNIEQETCNGLLHAFYHLHLADSYRSSSSNPNFQNFPIRRPEVAKLIRSAFVPRNDKQQLVEFDFKGMEVSVSACYNHDPKLIEYITDTKTDMHRDMAEQCYLLSRKELTPQNDTKEEAKRAKNIRYVAKNRFTFPEFYGNWYKAVTKDLWMGISELNLHTIAGKSLKEHLRKMGIHGRGACDPKEQDPRPGTFEAHIKAVEDDFWHNRFKVYNQWKRDWNQTYLEKGYFDTLTGFRCQTLMDRKQAVNYPIQGSAFHCLLWSLIRVQKLLRKYKLKSLIVGQIHDSMLMDVLVSERKEVIKIVRQVTMEDLAKHWRWIIVPMRIDVEAAPPGESWYMKKEIKVEE